VVKIAQINRAHQRIQPYVRKTPILNSNILDKKFGAKLYFKCENFQKTGSFKIRGAANTIQQIDNNELKNGIVTASSGNHGAALSRLAKDRGIPCTIIMPKNSSKIKVDKVIKNDGKIIWCEPNQDSREKTLNKIISSTGAIPIHPYNDKRIIAGQGTVSKELLDQKTNLDIVISPVSGGGLLAGTLCFIKQTNPNIKVFGAEPKEADDAFRSLDLGKIVENQTTNTICDGLRAQIGTITFPIVQKYINNIITVSESEIIKSMRLIWDELKIIIEPSCAITLAAVKKKKEIFSDSRVGLILSGGNVDLDNLPW
tara:strand:- start:936 stop:1874 length:939 start_codon:yes stop_codon:yes gene_type:complete